MLTTLVKYLKRLFFTICLFYLSALISAQSEPAKKKIRKGHGPRRHYLFIAGSALNERILYQTKKYFKFSPEQSNIKKSLLKRSFNGALLFGFAYKVSRRFYFESSLYAFAKTAYSNIEINENIVYMFLRRRLLPFTLHAKFGGGLALILPEFELYDMLVPQINLGIRARFKISKNYFIFIGFQESAIFFPDMDLPNKRTKKVKEVSLKTVDRQRYNLGLNYYYQ